MDILGIGNALLDIFCFSEDEAALSMGLHPNSSVHVSPERLDELMLAAKNPIHVAGGSAANALKAASALGHTCTFIGCSGIEDSEPDRWARIFSADLASFGVEVCLEERNVTSGRCLVLHMPGGLKTIACSPGAAPTVRPEQIGADIVAKAQLVLLDGQLLRNRAVVDRVANLCRGFNIPLAIDIASVDIARNHSSIIPELLARNDCILFANDDEALSLATTFENTVPGDRGLQTAEELMNSLFSFFTGRKRAFPCIVRKEGPKGATVWNSGSACHGDGDPVANPLDVTGAGDVFAGAFLSAFLRKLPFSEAIDIANKAARSSLSVPGTRLDWEYFLSLREEMGETVTLQTEEGGLQ